MLDHTPPRSSRHSEAPPSVCACPPCPSVQGRGPAFTPGAPGPPGPRAHTAGAVGPGSQQREKGLPHTPSKERNI
nr:MAG TPA: hypothetical protein [Caudoviricetes sp.]